MAQELWASPKRSPRLPSKNASRLFFLVFFLLLVGFLLLTFVFVFFPAFVSHGVPPFSLRLTVVLWRVRWTIPILWLPIFLILRISDLAYHDPRIIEPFRRVHNPSTGLPVFRPSAGWMNTQSSQPNRAMPAVMRRMINQLQVISSLLCLEGFYTTIPFSRHALSSFLWWRTRILSAAETNA